MKTNTKTIESKLFSIILNVVDGTLHYIYSEENSINCIVTPESHNIKNSLKNSKNVHSALIIIGKGLKKLHKKLRILEQSGVKNNIVRNELMQWNKLRKSLKNAYSQPRNNVLSMV
jgi:hypothetical protein